ncbi:MAG: helix-turn-helix transcriptional regulator [Crocinitomicaceae bacterium]|jgi:transcriptional regulator with XRE-family HTH domain|nr:helix-turn-helix transcriptional regulator [Crocinitomicaceae bacterium]MBP6032357.1 helix-turn-helix transcriptional regulator [Crocinitomicaceae bacterium]
MTHLHAVIKQIKERREMLKVTQEDLANLSGIGLRTIKELESGKANPTYRTLQEITDVLGLELVLQVKRGNSI